MCVCLFAPEAVPFCQNTARLFVLAVVFENYSETIYYCDYFMVLFLFCHCAR